MEILNDEIVATCNRMAQELLDLANELGERQVINREQSALMKQVIQQLGELAGNENLASEAPTQDFGGDP